MTPSSKPLGDLEQDVMTVVWQLNTATVRSVWDKLQRTRDIAYTTVMTTMDRLTKKGILTRTKINKAYHYTATVTEQQWHQSLSHQVLDKLVRQYGDLAIAQFVDVVDAIDPSKLQELKRQIDQRK